MNVFDVKGKAVITMTHEELGLIRYALGEGVEKLEQNTRYLKRMATLTGTGKDVARHAGKTSRDIRRVSDALEAATQKWAHTPTKVKS